MKKLLIALLMFVGITYSQTITGNPPQLPRIPQDPTGARGSLLLQYDAVSGTYSYAQTAGTFTTVLDSFSTGDTVKIFYFNGRCESGFLTLYDSTGVTDTFYVERYDTLSPYSTRLWTNRQMGYVDLSNGGYTPLTTGRYGIVSHGVIIPGSGLIKMYYINEPRPRTYRIWIPASVAAGKKKYIKWGAK